MGIGERIRAIRGEMSQRDFAEILGVSKGVISNYETGKQNPGSLFLLNLCDYFKIEPRWILKGEGEMFDNKEINNSQDMLRHNMSIDFLRARVKLLEKQYAVISKNLLIAQLEFDRAKTEEHRAYKKQL